ncbi:UDP-N-acetylmuramoyl-L-alanyl-D-glutamate--2,6-diaminopimelate ligase [Inmirania thermothiophila]|uniref:UDP-N-acetylmuramoyl-L-alanyl-D-glutamate--2,6-diaminopimelate ligase n=1 Tax=Inmirania thermothiophila TaxID=1750597 RepID=A0A3N1XSR0_9GAMM|nr:UDP-N-acetylmuramoyl-L-alanyl-D-glutamate--2,6-diaminopimelate ligase [Inmirania thermothiophila]ROR29679.1 UDP-N-acetylmuramoylalanyl-D-glutamate--2,6-diaminopimelate ligase [Inmirania thermothiophila]
MSALPRPVRRLDEILPEAPAVPVRGLALDSRRLAPGEVFLACRGSRGHGLAHLDAALAAGAAAVLWEPAPGVAPPAGLAVPAVAVPGLGRRAGELAARFWGDPSARLEVVGITGTNGKTSVAHFLVQAWEAAGVSAAFVGTLGVGRLEALEPTGHTTPDPVTLQARLADFAAAGVRRVAMEVSSHALDQDRVAGVRFRAAVFTNLSRDHLDYHGDMAAYGAAKARLLAWPGLALRVVNADDPFGAAWLARAGAEALTYGLGAGAWLRAEAVEATPAGLRLVLRRGRERAVLATPLAGRFNAANLLAAAAVLLGQGAALAEAVRLLAAVAPVPGRMERLGGGALPTVLVDYAHTPDALAQALEAARAHARGRLWCVFGCGGERDRGKRPLMGAAAERLADVVVLTDDNPRGEDGDAIIAEILAGMRRPQAARIERDRGRAIRLAVAEAGAGDVVLVAGKGHETTQEVGGRRLPWSDREAVRAALEARA